MRCVWASGITPIARVQEAVEAEPWHCELECAAVSNAYFGVRRGVFVSLGLIIPKSRPSLFANVQPSLPLGDLHTVARGVRRT